jgi:periplasmic divalent cation tolerance protein
MKSRADLFEQVAERVKRLHSYEVPEILALPIVDGSQTYFDWMSGILH